MKRLEVWTYRHKEAFCLMKYVAEDNSEVEWIWNSRDGVTPFCVHNRAGDKILRHSDWHLDRRILDYQPVPCERVFVSLSLERATQRAWRMVEQCWDRDTQMSQRFTTKENAVQELIKSYRIGVDPDLVIFGEISSPSA